MNYTITSKTTGETIGHLKKPDYKELEEVLKKRYQSERIDFDRQDPLPGMVSIRVYTKPFEGIHPNNHFYERVEISQIDRKKELLQIIENNLPFALKDVDDIIQRDGLIEVSTRTNFYILKWTKI